VQHAIEEIVVLADRVATRAVSLELGDVGAGRERRRARAAERDASS